MREVAPFGVLLRQYRQAASLSQEALARRAGLSPTAVAALERGRRRVPRPATVLLLAEAMDLAAIERATMIEAATRVRQDAPLLPTWRQNLPRELSSFVGREHELDELTRRLAEAPLVTVAGPGGAGKTRLAPPTCRPSGGCWCVRGWRRAGRARGAH